MFFTAKSESLFQDDGTADAALDEPLEPEDGSDPAAAAGWATPVSALSYLLQVDDDVSDLSALSSASFVSSDSSAPPPPATSLFSSSLFPSPFLREVCLLLVPASLLIASSSSRMQFLLRPALTPRRPRLALLRSAPAHSLVSRRLRGCGDRLLPATRPWALQNRRSRRSVFIFSPQ